MLEIMWKEKTKDFKEFQTFPKIIKDSKTKGSKRGIKSFQKDSKKIQKI